VRDSATVGRDRRRATRPPLATPVAFAGAIFGLLQIFSPEPNSGLAVARDLDFGIAGAAFDSMVLDAGIQVATVS
jgi:hypothetical protein